MTSAISPEIEKLVAAAAKAAVAEALGANAQSAKPTSVTRIYDATVRLGVSRTGLYRLINDGLLKTRKMGSMTVFLTADIDAYISSLKEIEPSAKKVSNKAVTKAD